MGVYWIHPVPAPLSARFPELFEKKLFAQFISYLPFTLMVWVSWPLYIFMSLASFLALWWPNIWLKMVFLELFEITIGSIHCILSIYPNGVSLLTPIHLRVPSLIFRPLVAKYLAENGVSGIFCVFLGWILLPCGKFLTFPKLFTYFCDTLSTMTLYWAKWCLNSSGTMFSWRIPTCVALDCKIEIFIGYFWMRWVVIRLGVYCPH